MEAKIVDLEAEIARLHAVIKEAKINRKEKLYWGVTHNCLTIWKKPLTVDLPGDFEFGLEWGELNDVEFVTVTQDMIDHYSDTDSDTDYSE